MQLFADGAIERRYASLRPPLVIGLVNSMPGEALRHTERQFRDILSAAAPDIAVELRFYSLDASADADQGAGPRYEDVGKLDAGNLDGLIVTGMPPRAAALADEPCWPKLTALVDHAVDRGIPTVWSCLAAHAAVLHLDGIERRRLPRKLSGLVECARVGAGHPLVAGLPDRWRMPHSRYNELPTDALAARGYRLLSWSDEAGADLFVKEAGALFLFCQGHPEYDTQTLFREYRRDIRQFLAGGRDDYPAMPSGYFGAEVAALLAEFERRSVRERTPDTNAGFPTDACLADLDHTWRDLAHGIYANWLAHIAARIAWQPAPGEAGWTGNPMRRPVPGGALAG